MENYSLIYCYTNKFMSIAIKLNKRYFKLTESNMTKKIKK